MGDGFRLHSVFIPVVQQKSHLFAELVPPFANVELIILTILDIGILKVNHVVILF